MPCRSWSTSGPERRMITPQGGDSEDEEQDQYARLRDRESGLRPGGRELVQISELLERLRDGDEDVQIERKYDTADIDRTPHARQPAAIDGKQGDGERDQRNKPQDVRQTECIGRQKKARD